jgi:hypothetical protein
MYFLEQYFGLYPDGGNGILEVSIIVAAVILVCALVAPAKLKRAATLSSGSHL